MWTQRMNFSSRNTLIQVRLERLDFVLPKELEAGSRHHRHQSRSALATVSRDAFAKKPGERCGRVGFRHDQIWRVIALEAAEIRSVTLGTRNAGQIPAALHLSRKWRRIVSIKVNGQGVVAPQHLQSRDQRVIRRRQWRSEHRRCAAHIGQNVAHVPVTQPGIHVPRHEIDQGSVAVAPVPEQLDEVGIVVLFAHLCHVGADQTQPSGLFVASSTPPRSWP
jgi:hypothetical protein